MQPLSYASSNSKSPKPPLYSTTWVLVIPQTLGRHYKLASIPNAFDSVGTTDEERETHPQGRKISTTSSKVCNLLYTLSYPTQSHMFQLFAGRVQQTKLNRRGGRQEAQWQPGRGRQHKSSDRASSQVKHYDLAVQYS